MAKIRTAPSCKIEQPIQLLLLFYSRLPLYSFITYRPCTHLDKQHTIFGRVVGGLDVLDKMEAVPTEKKTDKPDREIRILNVDVLVDPYQVYKDRLKNKLEKEANAAALAQEQDRLEAKRNSMGWFGPNVTKAQGKKAAAASNGVGKYLTPPTRKRDADDLGLGGDNSPSNSSPSMNSSSVKRAKGSYGNFDNF